MTVSCRLEYCDRGRDSKGLCSSHYAQQWRGEDLRPLKPKNRGLSCLVHKCPNAVANKGYCNKHALRIKASGTTVANEHRRHEIDPSYVTGFCCIKRCESEAMVREMDRRRSIPYPAMALCKTHSNHVYNSGLSFEVYVSLMLNDSCESCGMVGEPLHIDHDHSCLKHRPKRMCDDCVRGMICRGCNVSLGLLAESAERIESLAKYARSRVAQKHPNR